MTPTFGCCTGVLPERNFEGEKCALFVAKMMFWCFLCRLLFPSSKSGGGILLRENDDVVVAVVVVVVVERARSIIASRFVALSLFFFFFFFFFQIKNHKTLNPKNKNEDLK